MKDEYWQLKRATYFTGRLYDTNVNAFARRQHQINQEGINVSVQSSWLGRQTLSKLSHHPLSRLLSRLSNFFESWAIEQLRAGQSWVELEKSCNASLWHEANQHTNKHWPSLRSRYDGLFGFDFTYYFIHVCASHFPSSSPHLLLPLP